jgi:antitoxin (DNA-binding transcriptional repressor) of toxin-antitoxin stability system
VYTYGVTGISISQARAELPRIIDRVDAGEEVTITRHGTAVAVIVRPDLLRVRRDSQASVVTAEIREALETARDAPLPVTTDLSVQRADELIADMLASRTAR